MSTPGDLPAPPPPRTTGLTDEASLADLDEPAEGGAVFAEQRDSAPASAAPRAEQQDEFEAGAEALELEPQADPAAGTALGPGAELDEAELERGLFALLFASPDVQSEQRLRTLLQDPPPERVRAALARLPQRLAQSGLPLVLRQLAGGYRLLSAPEVAEFVARLSKARKFEKISPAALETLAIVAYRQPVTKAEIEAIRGVQSGPVLRALADRGLVRVSGRADQPGAPLQYATTRSFLDQFGLSGLEELPRDGELVRE